MKCECGYVGAPEYGNFIRADLRTRVHVRCPACHGRGGDTTLLSEERFADVALYPEYCAGVEGNEHRGARKDLSLTVESDAATVIYDFRCPICGMGETGKLEPRAFIPPAALNDEKILRRLVEALNPTIRPTCQEPTA